MKLTEYQKIRLGELLLVKRLITEVYPTGIVSLVMDTWGLFDVIDPRNGILKQLHDTIVKREGKVVIRPDCYSEDTSILTQKGWKLFKDLSPNDLVAQVDNGTMSWVSPTKYIEQDYTGEMHHFFDGKDKIDLLVTPNHRMILEQNGKERIVFAEKLSKQGHDKQKMLRSATSPSNPSRRLSPIEQLKIAFQADGSYVTQSNSKIRFAFSKERKLKRLTEILSKLDFEYSTYDLGDGRTETHVKVLDSSQFAKDLNWIDTTNLTLEYSRDIIEEASMWDGHQRSDVRYKLDSTNKQVIEKLELVGMAAGYGVLMSSRQDNRKEIFSDVHTLHVMKENWIGGQSWKHETVQYSGKVYCVTVPSGKIIVKRNRGTLVCGNSGDPVKIVTGWTDEEVANAGREISETERKGLIECLWDVFGGTTTSKGQRQLDEHIGGIYGDSITLERCEQICKRLAQKGFASTNLVYGIGSFTYQGAVTPNAIITRDTYGFAVKATYCELTEDGKVTPINIFKDPKTDDGLKKSATGLTAVYETEKGFELKDKATWEEVRNCSLKTVFRDGEEYNIPTLAEIRERIKSTN